MSKNKKSDFSLLDGYGPIADQKAHQEKRDLFMQEVLKIQNKTIDNESTKDVVWSADSFGFSTDKEPKGELSEKMVASGGTDLSQVMNKIAESVDNKNKKVIVLTDAEPPVQDNLGVSRLDKLKAVLKTQGVENESPENQAKAIKKILGK